MIKRKRRKMQRRKLNIPKNLLISEFGYFSPGHVFSNALSLFKI